MSGIQERLARGGLIILDGGTGTELERRGVPMHEEAWCGAAVLTHGEVLRQVHADYIGAGADVVIANTFATSRFMLEAAGQGDKVAEVNRRAVELARAARDQAAAGREVWVAGSISPMAPGSDHTRRPEVAAAGAAFREQAEILAEAGADLIILEMMRDVDYTSAAIDAARATGLPFWVGFSCELGAGGEVVMFEGMVPNQRFAVVVGPAMARGGGLLAVMHSAVEVTQPALEVARQHWDGPLGAYPHSGHFVMPHWHFDSVISPEAYLAEAQAWVAMGVQVVGGCCGIGPEHIRLLAERLPGTRQPAGNL